MISKKVSFLEGRTGIIERSSKQNIKYLRRSDWNFDTASGNFRDETCVDSTGCMVMQAVKIYRARFRGIALPFYPFRAGNAACVVPVGGSDN